MMPNASYLSVTRNAAASTPANPTMTICKNVKRVFLIVIDYLINSTITAIVKITF